MDEISKKQREICNTYAAQYTPLDWGLKVGVSVNLFSGEMPVNGCRVVASETTCGWYLWAGETFSEAADWFEPIHAHHLLQKLPEVIPYLGLPTGWRFLLAPGYEDVWYDTELLKTEID
jgi:hypothetical protein